MIDVCTINGWANTTINIIRLIQGISQAHWPAESASTMLLSKQLHVYSFPDLIEKWNSNKNQRLFSKIVQADAEILNKMPVLDVTLTIGQKPIRKSHHGQSVRNSNTWNLVNRDDDNLTVKIEKQN